MKSTFTFFPSSLFFSMEIFFMRDFYSFFFYSFYILKSGNKNFHLIFPHFLDLRLFGLNSKVRFFLFSSFLKVHLLLHYIAPSSRTRMEGKKSTTMNSFTSFNGNRKKRKTRFFNLSKRKSPYT